MRQVVAIHKEIISSCFLHISLLLKLRLVAFALRHVGIILSQYAHAINLPRTIFFSNQENKFACSRIAKEYGEKSIQSARSPQKLAADLDIPEGHAMKIIAAVELGRRLFNRNPSGAQVIRTAQDVYDYARSMADLPKEHLRGIYLNSHYKVVHDEVISIGTIDTNLIHPREVFRPALEYAVAAVLLVHNHPSGSLEPSEADIVVTRQLIEAGKLLGIDLVDHVIISREGFASIFDSTLSV